MYVINYIPLKGIQIINLGEINFNMTIDDAILLIGNPSSIDYHTENITDKDSTLNNPFFGALYYFDDLELRIDTNQKKEIVLIESLYGINSIKTQAFITDREIFKTTDIELIALLTKLNTSGPDHAEETLDYIFENINVAIYRENTPIMVKEELLEIDPVEDAEYRKELLLELKTAKFFSTFSIGAKGYYSY